MMECHGHYVYYEKNIEMQNYMIATRKRTGFTPSEVIEDRVTKNFRSLVREKAKENEQKGHSRWVYAMSTFLVLVILIIGVTMINNYDKMKQVQDTISQTAKKDTTDEEGQAVEAVGDNVTAKQEETDIPAEEPKKEEEQPKEEEPKEQPEVEQPQEEQPQEQQPQENREEHEVYIVQKGDTLVSICVQKYGSSLRINDICKLNGLEDGNLIFIGQKLLLP